MKITGSGYTFESTGREVNAHGTGHIGLNVSSIPFFDENDIGMGYDQYFSFGDEDNEADSREIIELCDFMIEQWGNLKKQYL